VTWWDAPVESSGHTDRKLDLGKSPRNQTVSFYRNGTNMMSVALEDGENALKTNL
jgi:hypothetical protein